MSPRTSRIVRAIIASAAVPALVAGCAPTSEAPDARERIRVAVESIETVEGALVNLSSAGVDALAVRVKIYLPAGSDLVAVVDSTLETVWREAPASPERISISAVFGTMPDDARMSTPDGTDLTPVAEQLGFTSAKTSLDVLLVPAVDLRERYGAWVGPDE